SFELTADATWPWLAVLIFWMVYLKLGAYFLNSGRAKSLMYAGGAGPSVSIRTRALPVPFESLMTQSATAVCIVPETPRMSALSALGSAGSAGWSAVTTLMPFLVAAVSWLATTCQGAASSTIAATFWEIA